MSAYYHSPMRNFFVGFLFAIGAVLYLYKGFHWKENWALNAAGLSAFLVALIPTGTHGASAIFLFVCIAYVSIFRNEDTVQYILNEDRIKLCKRTHKLLGGLMVLLP